MNKYKPFVSIVLCALLVTIQIFPFGFQNAYAVELNDENITVNFDLNYEGSSGAPISQSVTGTAIVVKPSNPVRHDFR